jgi:sulfate transport system permease protein
VVVVLPLSALALRVVGTPWHRVVAIVTAPRTLAALRLTILCSAAGALVAVALGSVIAWALGRYRFPGHSVLDAAVEIPLALPTSVAGITLTYLYSEHGWFGSALARVGVHVAFTPIGITLALAFVGLPFAARAVQPVVMELDADVDEAARSLGASPSQIFTRVHVPTLAPAVVSAFALSLARGLGEYGSVLFISGNLPFETEVAPLLIVSKLEQFDYEGAAVLAAVLLVAVLTLLAVVHKLERWVSRRFDAEPHR